MHDRLHFQDISITPVLVLDCDGSEVYGTIKFRRLLVELTNVLEAEERDTRSQWLVVLAVGGGEPPNKEMQRTAPGKMGRRR